MEFVLAEYVMSGISSLRSTYVGDIVIVEYVSFSNVQSREFVELCILAVVKIKLTIKIAVLVPRAVKRAFRVLGERAEGVG